MKFRVTMKDADVLDDAIDEAAKRSLSDLGLDDDEAEVLADGRAEKAYAVCGKWFRYGEYLTVEIDTDTSTCVVVEAGR